MSRDAKRFFPGDASARAGELPPPPSGADGVRPRAVNGGGRHPAAQRIVWSDEYSVGVPLLDEQHKRLIMLLNDVSATTAPERFFEAIMKMYHYADEHFRAEEVLMRRYGYEKVGEHVRAHREFMLNVADLAGRDYVQLSVQREIRAFLRHWLIHHTLTMDQDYRALVSGGGGTDV